MVRPPADVFAWISKLGEVAHPGQVAIFKSPARYKLAVCGGGFGKSWTASRLAECHAITGNRSWEIGTTYDLSDRIFERCWDDFTERKWIVRPGSSRGDRKIILPSGGIIEGKSADHPDSLIGQGIDHADFDEAATYSGDIFFGKVLPRIARNHGSAFIITTPRGRRNWIYKLYRSILQGHASKSPAWADWAVWKLPSWVNTIAFPGGRTDPEIVAAEQRYSDAGMDGLFEQEFGAEFVTLHGRVYKKWNEDTHVVDPAAAAYGIRDWFIGIDWGHRVPCAILVMGRTHDGDWRCVDEWYEKGKIPSEILAAVVALQAKYRVTTIFYDPEDPGQGAAVRRAMPDGVHVSAAFNDRDTGRMAVATALGRKGGLLVSRACRNLIDEIGDYHYPEESERRETEDPVKVHDHACLAAGTPVLTRTGEVGIERVREGDEVLTREGWRNVVASGMTRASASVYRVNLSDGSSLDATGDHRVLSADGAWIPVDALRYGVRLWAWQKQSDSTGSSSGDTPSRTTGQPASTTHPASRTRCAGLDDCTRRSGRTPTVQYQTGTTSITLTETRSTTTSEILRASQRASTPYCTTEIGNRQTPNEGTLKASDHSQPSGTDRMLGWSGTNGTASSPGSGETETTADANAAACYTFPGGTRGLTAQTAVVLPLEGPGETTTSSEHAPIAVTRSRSTGTCKPSTVPVYVLSAHELPGRVPVYNIEVSGSHEFFAAGVLVHNCDALRYVIATMSKREKRGGLAVRYAH